MAAMLDEVFAEAIVHKPVPWHARIFRSPISDLRSPISGHKILGLRVRPFSFWHAFNLDLIGYAAENLTQFNTLLLSVRCCRLRYPQTIATAGLWEAFLHQLASLRFAFRFANRKKWKFRIQQIKKFLDYRADYADCVPEMAECGEPIKIPGYLYQVALLRRLNPGLTKAQAWDFPIAEAQWEILAALAAQGAKIDVLTPEDRQDLADMESEARKTPKETFGARAEASVNGAKSRGGG